MLGSLKSLRNPRFFYFNLFFVDIFLVGTSVIFFVLAIPCGESGKSADFAEYFLVVFFSARTLLSSW